MSEDCFIPVTSSSRIDLGGGSTGFLVNVTGYALLRECALRKAQRLLAHRHEPRPINLAHAAR
jgi:hypothetical protein